MTKSFKEKTATSFFWVTVEKLSLKLLQFIISIILARILLPEEFGLIGVLGVFISLSMVLIDSGFSFTLIRKEHVSDGDYNVVFWFNLSVSIFSFILLWIASPYIAPM